MATSPDVPGGNGSSALDKLKSQAQSGPATPAPSSSGGGSVSSQQANDPVYIATTAGKKVAGKAPGIEDSRGGMRQGSVGGTIAPSDTSNTIDGALQDFYTWDRGKMNKFRQLGALGGMNNMNASDTQLFDTWKQMVVTSARYTSAGRKISPWDVLANAIPGDPLGLGRGKKGGGGGTGDFQNNQGMDLLSKSPDQISKQAASAAQDATKAKNPTVGSLSGGLSQKQLNVSKTVDYTDPDTARFVLNTAEATLLGRQSTPDEAKAFYSKLTEQEKKFPKQSQSVFTPNQDNPNAAASSSAAVSVDSNGNPVDAQGNIVTPNAPAQMNQQTGSTETTSLNEADYQRYGREQVAQDFARTQPDYGAFQASTTYLNAFLQAIGGPPGLK